MGGLFLLATVFAGFTGCIAPEPPPTRRPFTPIGAAPEGGQARAAKAKGAKGAKVAKTGKGKATKQKAPASPPVGVAGPVAGVLTLTTTPAADGVAASTASEIALTFSDQTSHVEKLGQVPGACTEVPATPLTSPQGQSVPVLWSVDCAGTGVFVVQRQAQLLIVKADPPAVEGGRPKMKIVKRITLAPGAVVARKA
jgi:hypothetical protein